MKIDETQFEFLNLHLAYGKGQPLKRMEVIENLVQQALLKDKTTFDPHAILIVFGDLNFRIALDYS